VPTLHAGLERVQAETGERHVPPFHPAGIKKAAALEPGTHRARGPQVSVVKQAARILLLLEPGQSRFHPRDQRIKRGENGDTVPRGHCALPVPTTWPVYRAAMRLT